MLLVDIGQLHGLAHLEGALVGLVEPHDEAEQGGLAHAIGTYHAYDASRGQAEVEVAVKHLVAKFLGDVVSLDHLVAQSRAVGDEDFKFLLFLLLVLIQELVVGVEAGLALGLAGLGGHAHPLELTLERLASLAGGFLFLSHALRLLVEPRRVVALPGDALATVELKNPASHVVEEVAVVGHGNHSALILVEVLLEPVDRLGVEVVGGLVEQEHIGL